MSKFNTVAILVTIFFLGSLFLDSANGYIGKDCKNSTCGDCELCLFVVPDFDWKKGRWECQASCLHPGDDCGSDLQCLSGDNNTRCDIKSVVPYLRQECDCVAGFNLNKKYKKCVQGDYCEVDVDCRPGASCSSDQLCVDKVPMTNCTVDADCGDLNSTICDKPFAHSSRFCLPSKVGHGKFCDVDRQCGRNSTCHLETDQEFNVTKIPQLCQCRPDIFKYSERLDQCIYFDSCDMDSDCSSDQECNDYHQCVGKTPMSGRTIGLIVLGSIIGVAVLIAGFFIVKALRAQERTWERANERTRIVNT